MRTKRFIIFAACFAFIFLTVGSGFAFFFFGDSSVKNDSTVTVTPESALELGSVSLVDNGYDYRLFFDTDHIFLFRNDNPTADVKMAVVCELVKKGAVPQGYSLSLACDITVSDSDGRGVKKEVFSHDGVTESYMYSDSVVDYFLPTAVSFNDKEHLAFTAICEGNAEKSVTYRCVLLNDLQSLSENNLYTTEYFKIMFDYKMYHFIDGAEQNTGNIAPSAQYSSPEGFKKNMEAIENAKANSQIAVVFRLIVQKERA